MALQRLIRTLSVITAILIFAVAIFAQSTDTKADMRSAREIFEDANGYLGRRYQEFNKQKLPYDAKLEAQTKKEQRDLAARNAATLQARGSL